MKIIDKVERVRDGVIKDTQNGGTKGFDMKVAAIKAALAGIGSAEWKSYMTIFADNEEQLNRLNGADAHAANPWVKETSAYLVVNGTCGGFTPSRLPEFLDGRVDDAVSDATDPNFDAQKLIKF